PDALHIAKLVQPVERGPGRHAGVLRAGQLLDDADHLAGVTELVVVPDIEHEVLAGSDRRAAIDDTSVGRTHEVGGDDLRGVDVVHLRTQLGDERDVAQGVVDIVLGDLAGHGGCHYGQGDVWGRVV